VLKYIIRKLESSKKLIFQTFLYLLRAFLQPKPVVRQQSQQSGYRREQQQNAYRSPDEINISLQQRRPYFAQTTPRYEEEEEYSYEK
jgi:hypothetical protein